MGKTGKWLKKILTGKKDNKEKCSDNQICSIVTENPWTPNSVLPGTPKEKRRWSFRRSSATTTPKDLTSLEQAAVPVQTPALDMEDEQKKHAVAEVADAAVVIRRAAVANGRASTIEEAAAIRIQAAYRACLARKALNALKGLVKLQAVVRGHLVRKQAMATLRCMQALISVQARARAQRIRMAEDANPLHQKPPNHRKFTQNQLYYHNYHDNDRCMEENIKIVEMDFAGTKSNSRNRNSYSVPNNPQTEKSEHRYSNYSNQQISPAPSALADMSPRASSGHFQECSYSTAQGSPQNYSSFPKPDPTRLPSPFSRSEYAESVSHDYPPYPSYMANTESSRAKARSQSAPKSRPDSYERQPSARRRASIEGRNVPRAVTMQRSSSHIGVSAQTYQFPWSIKLDRSTASLKESECGSTSTVLTNANYCRSLVGFDPDGKRY